MEWPANYTFFSANVCVVFICEPPLTKHDPGFNFIDRKKSLTILGTHIQISIKAII